MKRDLISINDLPRSYIEKIFRKTDEFKEHKIHSLLLENKILAMIFAKPSTRTRVSFEAGMTQLGGHAIFLGVNDIQLGHGETIADTARALSRYADGIMARLFRHEDLLELAKYSKVPVINGLTDLLHPCQALADLYTIDEKLERLRGVRLTYLGDANNNICHSLIHACSKLGVQMTIACPKVFIPDMDILDNARRNCKLSKSRIVIMSDPKRAVADAEVIYTDTWVSMGQETEAKDRLRALRPYQVSKKLLKLAKPYCLFMHDLPAYRGKEVTAQVIDGPNSIVFDQAENRLHVQKGILALLLG